MIIITKYISCIALFILLIQYLSLLWRGKNLDKKTGALLLKTKGKPNKVFYPAAALIPLIVIVQFFRELSLPLSLVIDSSAVIALEVLIREKILTERSGVYENVLISDGRFLLKTDIISFPTLSYENDETDEENSSNVYAQDVKELKQKTLKIVTRKNGIIFIGFTSREEREEVVNIVRTWTE